MERAPLVSILINNYNYGRFLAEAIDSALDQQYEAFEVIVVDDGSTDNSLEVVASYGDRISLVSKKNGGQASAFNAGFAASRGEIICFLDSDDLFLPDKLAYVADIFAKNPDIGWCFDTPEWFGAPAGDRYAGADVCKAGIVDARKMLADARSPYVPAATSGLSFRRELLQQILPMPDIIRITSDNYIKIAALSISTGWLSSETVSMQRIHGSNAYTNLATGKRRLVGRTELLTGISLHERFPALKRLALKVVCNGIIRLLRSGGLDPELRKLTFSYIRSVGFVTWSTAFAKTAGFTALRGLRRSRRVKSSREVLERPLRKMIRDSGRER